MRKYSVVLIAIMVSFMVGLCNAAPDQQSKPTPPNLSATQKELVTASNKFAFNIFRQINEAETDTNIFISPFSIHYALGMTYNGAAGDTKDSMADVLQFGDLTDQEINKSYKGLSDILTTIDPNVMMEIANSIWIRKGIRLLKSFTDINKQYFDATATSLNFNDPMAAKIMNDWITEKTHGRIKDVIEVPIKRTHMVFLINTTYFKGKWTYEFEMKNTKPLPFYPDSNTQISCDMMSQENNFMHNFNEDFQAVDLPYSDAGFSMAIFLPRPGKTPDDLIAKLNAKTWEDWLASFNRDMITITMPKLKMLYKRKLNDDLKALGMGIAFDGIDFSRMTLGGGLYISKVLHDTFIQVDEEGTEAAGATVVVLNGLIPMGKETTMTVDRPFLFVIHDIYTGAILFMGKITNPVWEEG
jgi:serine protease inhibitor